MNKTKFIIFARLKYFILPILILSLIGCAKARILSLLTNLAKNEKLKEQAVRQETINFEKAKNFISANEVETGFSKEDILRDIGEPSLIISEEEKEKWVYKAAGEGWMGGEKIYLFFDREDNLIEWEHIGLETEEEYLQEVRSLPENFYPFTGKSC
ncbi:MAG: hypothetical protein DRP74_00190 [Candidatus Omnitrophota bacterium]|nr:MAG: hypothetical protein DRP74_00190 [Candidatus Omnitrophota bacterium]